MAGRAVNRLLLIVSILICTVSAGFAEAGEKISGIVGEPQGKSVSADSSVVLKPSGDGEVSFDRVGAVYELRFRSFAGQRSLPPERLFNADRVETANQEQPETQFGGVWQRLDPDYSLEIAYSHRSLKQSFLESTDILTKRGFEDQYLYSIDIAPSVIFSDRYTLKLTYSFIPEQRNFPGSTVLTFQNERIILNDVNRFSGHALSAAAAYSVPVTDGISAAIHLGFERMMLDVEETMQYHPDDPFARNFSIITLPFRKRQVTYANPYAGLSAEFQLGRISLNTGYQLHLYQLELVSSSNFYISLGVRFGEWF